jgi:hypothetical protein
LFSEASLDLLESAYTVDGRALSQLRAGFPLDARFRGRSHECLARTRALYVLRPSDERPSGAG